MIGEKAPDLDESVLARLRVQIGSATVDRLVGLSRTNVRDRQAAALEAVNNEDLSSLSQALHSIKGSAQLIGARRLEEVSARWEERARSGEIETVALALDEIADAFSRVELALEAFRSKPR